VRHGNKYYWKIPGGEIQYGLISRCLRVWFLRKCYTLKRPNRARIERYFGPNKEEYVK
jgi:hypothetical protein